MRNKRILTLLLLLAIVLFLGIGYALSNKTLLISGSADVTALDTNFIIRFKKTGDNYDKPTNAVNAEGSVTSDSEATINVTGLKKAGDVAQVTYTVENASNGINADVVAQATETLPDYFKVTTEGITETKTTINSGSEQTITVKVELIKTPIEDKKSTVTVNLTATPVE